MHLRKGVVDLSPAHAGDQAEIDRHGVEDAAGLVGLEGPQIAQRERGVGDAFPRGGDHGGGDVDAEDGVAGVGEGGADGAAGAAADVEDLGGGGQVREEPAEGGELFGEIREGGFVGGADGVEGRGGGVLVGGRIERVGGCCHG